MKRSLIIALLTIAFGIMPLAAQNAAPIQLVFIGNSITQGARLANPIVEGPATQTALLLNGAGRSVEVLNRGLSGTTTFDWLPNDTTRCFPPLITTTDAFFRPGATHIFSVMLGTNDSAETRCNGAPVNPERYGENLSAIIDSLLTRYPDAKVILNYPIWYSPTTYNGARYLQGGLDRLQTYHPVIDRIVASRPGQVFAGRREAYDAFAGKPQLFDEEDGRVGKFYLHPNAEGARLLATFWAAAVLDVVGSVSAAQH